MELIERYLHEVGRHLPRRNRKDILGEMRSALADALEDQAGPTPTEEQVIAVLKTFGEPRKVASTYYPESQYLVGPTLYPLFRMVAGITLAAVLGAQVIAWLVSLLFAGQMLDPLEVSSGLVNSLPATLGWVLIVFMILQRFDVRPDLADEAWDPASLPPVDTTSDVSRAEKVAGIIVQSIILAVLIWFSDHVGVYIFPGGTFYPNPVLIEAIPWIVLSLLVGIGLDVYLLWQGRWTITSRIARLAANLLSIAILALLSNAHMAWLQAHNAGTFLSSIQMLETNLDNGVQIIMMQGFWLGITIALVVTVIETIVSTIRLVKKTLER